MQGIFDILMPWCLAWPLGYQSSGSTDAARIVPKLRDVGTHLPHQTNADIPSLTGAKYVHASSGLRHATADLGILEPRRSSGHRRCILVRIATNPTSLAIAVAVIDSKPPFPSFLCVLGFISQHLSWIARLYRPPISQLGCAGPGAGPDDTSSICFCGRTGDTGHPFISQPTHPTFNFRSPLASHLILHQNRPDVRTLLAPHLVKLVLEPESDPELRQHEFQPCTSNWTLHSSTGYPYHSAMFPGCVLLDGSVPTHNLPLRQRGQIEKAMGPATGSLGSRSIAKEEPETRPTNLPTPTLPDHLTDGLQRLGRPDFDQGLMICRDWTTIGHRPSQTRPPIASVPDLPEACLGCRTGTLSCKFNSDDGTDYSIGYHSTYSNSNPMAGPTLIENLQANEQYPQLRLQYECTTPIWPTQSHSGQASLTPAAK
ncbi:uncharacterized protein CLUP02_03545 [Colletotrichum lupini]|uniref:Uncharacterized protein n=1 Tax=Colletotrichum lupini TaxID=145971 RepID=A0A9Q8SJJ2_9PEZI|nr:uncharacterized protein CLUP02_03545 [Colletotrichum lupini]UQC78071.1 hypothetical protein CLUP02_03545 [Colletotrichum lupini]